MPPNTTGIAALMMLNIMEQYPLGEWGFHSTKALHVMIEAKKLAYADLIRYIGELPVEVGDSTFEIPGLESQHE